MIDNISCHCCIGGKENRYEPSPRRPYHHNYGSYDDCFASPYCRNQLQHWWYRERELHPNHLYIAVCLVIGWPIIVALGYLLHSLLLMLR